MAWVGVFVLAACSAARTERAVDDRADREVEGTSAVVATRTAPPASAEAEPTRLSLAIATGGPRETNYRIGQDLARFVAPDAGIALDVLATRGSDDNLHRLADDPRVDLAIVQYDVLRSVKDEARRGSKAASRLIDPLRIVTPLFTEEIHFVVRGDAAMHSVDDIRGKRINLGARGSGSALTAAALYRRMFGSAIPPANARYLSDELGLSALVVERSVDVVVIVAAQPTTLFTDMKPEARNYIRLLPVGDDTPATRAALKVYLPATIRARSYASWLTQDVPAFSVVSFLVTSDRTNNALIPHLGAFARALCRADATLKAAGHPKWREVRVGTQLGAGLPYAAASESEFMRCTTP